MKQHLLTLFLALAASVAPLFAQSGTCGDNLTWTLDTESGILTISGTGAMKDYTDYSSSYAPWYSYRESIKTVKIGSSVTSIGDYAFRGCSSLTSITIPNSVTSIENHAFSYCSSLTSITIPNSVTSIGEGAFWYCSSLTSITIPNSVTSIGDNAFYKCSKLTSITIPNSVTSIGKYAFSDCSKLTSPVFNAHVFANMPQSYSGAYTIPDGIESIAGGAFEYCRNLTSVTIPNSVTSIGDYAFSGCRSLTSITVDYGNLNYCDIDGVLFNKDKTALIRYPEGKSATSYIIPNSVTSIGYGAFIYCSSLTSITIPSSVTSIEYGAFYYCSSLTSVTIPNSVTSIGDGAFVSCNSLTSVTIPNSVTSIGDAAFEDCSSLTSVTIPNSVTSIGYRAFYYCRSLTSITIPTSVTSIEGDAFYNCSSLTSVTIPNSVTSIGVYAFYECSSLTTLTCEAVAPPTLENYVFYNVDKSIPLYVPAQSIDLYKAANQWKDFTNILPIGGNECVRIIDKVDTCSAALPFTWRPWHNGGIVITDISQNGIKDIVYKEGSTTVIDSIVTLSLTLHEPQKVPVEVKDTFWQCEYDMGEDIWVSPVVYDYELGVIHLDIPNAIGTTYKTLYTDIYGCDSITIHEVIIIPEKVQRLFEFCQSDLSLGDNIEIEPRLILEGSFWGNFSGDSIIRDTTQSVYCFGFDSITIDTIRIYPAYRETWNPGICADEMEDALADGIPFYDLGPVTDLSQNGLEYYTEGSIHGCDSIIVLDLTPIPNDTIDEHVQISEFPYTFKGVTFNSINDTLYVITPGNLCKEYIKLIPTLIQYTVTFKNEDGTILDSRLWNYGATPTCFEPTKPADAQYTYTFAGWDKEIATVTADATYTATYTRTVNRYTVTFMDGNTVLGEPQTVEYGQAATAPEVEIPQCRSLSWDKNFSKIISNLTVKAVWTTIPLASGTCGAGGDGSNITWELNCDGLLTFSGKGRMEDYSLPHGLSYSFAQWVLYNNTIISVVLSQGVTSIGNYAFYGCDNMTSVEIPNSVTSIGTSAFIGCSGIQSIVSKVVTPPALGSDVFYGVDKSIPLYVPAESLNAYKAADQWKDFWKILPDYLINDETLCPSGEAGLRDQFLYDRDSIVLDTYTDSNDDWLQYMERVAPQKWDYNKFIRVRAWSNRSENTDNYIQFYWWIGDGNNPDLSQSYANGIGPKAGTYTLTNPMMGLYSDSWDYTTLYNYIVYWTDTVMPKIQPKLLAYRTHVFYNEYIGGNWICPFSSYASNAGDLSKDNNIWVMADTAGSYITHFNSLPVIVAEGDDGNIFIQIGGQEEKSMPAVTIGSRTVFKLNTSVEGEGMVYVNPNCEYHIVGETVNLVPVPSNQSIRFKGWIGEHADNVIFNGDGTYTFTMPEHDCSLTAKFEAIQPIDCTIETTDGITVWEDQLPYTWEGISFTTAGTETKTLQASDGCDSIVTFTLRVLYRNITLQENESSDYYTQFAQDYNGQRVTTATLNRQFTSGKWSTFCLPFNVNKAMMTALGLYNRVFELRYAEQLDDETIQMYFAPAQSIEAGKGYIVNANTKLAQKTSFVFPNVTINTDSDNGDITALTGYNDGTNRGNLYLVGTLRTGILQGSTSGNTYLGLKDNQLYYPNSTSGTPMRAYRAVFRSDIPVNAQRVRIIADGEPVTELEVTVDEQGRMDNGQLQNNATPARKYIRNGILFIERNGVTYTAQGQRID